MEPVKSRQLPILFYGLSILLIIITFYQSIKLYELQALQQAVDHPDTVTVTENTPPIVIFAKALYLDHAGKSAEAIRLYSSLRNTKDLDFRARVLHNLANSYLRDGAQHWNAHGVLDYVHVSTQVELAKQYYREALRLNPEDWDARHNLEYAWRITPPPREKPKSDFQGTKPSVFSTLPGLPGGGP